ncbi:MAG: hypothetical protein RR142_12410, partial [Clostridia bacterium]
DKPQQRTHHRNGKLGEVKAISRLGQALPYSEVLRVWWRELPQNKFNYSLEYGFKNALHVMNFVS